MAEHSDVIDRVDALMRSEGLSPAGRRRRSFIAAPASSEEPFELLTHPEDDDLPVLTEIVSVEAAVSEPVHDRFDETLISIIASDLVQSLEQQLAIELPTLIEASLINAQNELRAGVSSTLELALRDFLERRRQQLRLPLEERRS